MRISSILRRIAIACAIPPAVMMFAALAPYPSPPRESLASGAPSRRIAVLSNPIHTDIALPLDADMRARFQFLERFGMPVSDPAARWLVVGWGGRAFYIETPTWADLKPLPVLKAFTLDRSVLHLDLAGGMDEAHPQVALFNLAPERFERLVAFIEASFTRRAGEVMEIPATAYGPHDRFFEAEGYFNAFFGCNTWTASALRQAGLRTGLWNPLPQTLTLSLKLHN